MRWSILISAPFLFCGAACETDEPAPPDTSADTTPDTADTADTTEDTLTDTAPDTQDDTQDVTDTADTSAPPGCCRDALTDCGIGAVCVPAPDDPGGAGWGRCEPLTAEGCYIDEQCPEGATCEGEVVCPCGAVCVRADSPGVCVGPGPLCCISDESCGEREVCAEVPGGSGTCKPLAGLSEGQCWADSTCPPLRPKGPICLGERVCPCGALCLLEDAPGTCHPLGCCLSDADCSGSEECAQASPNVGTCKHDESLTFDECWADDDCDPVTEGERCLGERVCPCEAMCVIADREGRCRPGNCCEIDADCDPGEQCAPATEDAGTCKPSSSLEPGECWANDDCEGAALCFGASVCPCESSCLVADHPGRCEVPVPEGCCRDDLDCEATEECAPAPGGGVGTCKPAASLDEGRCWANDDCGGGVCFGARVCPCAALCILPDVPGRCGPSTCEALDPFGFGACDMVIGVVFDGKQCVTASGCGCGEHCDEVFPTMESCLEVCKPSCVALDPHAYGLCAMVLGAVFDGKECVTASGCGCDDDCDHFFTSLDACGRACGLACVTVDPYEFGACERVLGVGYDGTKCVTVSGCSCGEKCDLLFPSYGACEAACD